MSETKKKTRELTEMVRDLRTALKLTQQDFATAMDSAISTVVRYEHGSRPNVQQLAKMLDLARENNLADLVAEFQLHLNLTLGPAFPLTPDPDEQLCVWLARRINQDPKRRAEFYQWAAPEMARLTAENRLRKDRADDLFAGFDAHAEKLRAKAKKGAAHGKR